MPSIRVGKTIVKVGDQFVSNSKAVDYGICPSGVRVYIECVKNRSIGIYAPDHCYGGWHDLDERVDHGHGYWVEPDQLDAAFDIEETFLEIKDSLKFKDMDLKGMKCKMLRRMGVSAHSYVELEKNVGGSGADGLGKQGHCVVVPNGVLRKLSTKTAKM